MVVGDLSRQVTASLLGKFWALGSVFSHYVILILTYVLLDLSHSLRALWTFQMFLCALRKLTEISRSVNLTQYVIVDSLEQCRKMPKQMECFR